MATRVASAPSAGVFETSCVASLCKSTLTLILAPYRSVRRVEEIITFSNAGHDSMLGPLFEQLCLSPQAANSERGFMIRVFE
jgi:hypothetical protein